ncbi:hypothetical protein J2741_001280 [Methanolinea mesophila]|nr:hypothetical protein [Methanolinea mesophila]
MTGLCPLPVLRGAIPGDRDVFAAEILVFALSLRRKIRIRGNPVTRMDELVSGNPCRKVGRPEHGNTGSVAPGVSGRSRG